MLYFFILYRIISLLICGQYGSRKFKHWKEEDMNITDVRIRVIKESEKMKAVASITFDDEFVVHDIKIIDGQNGLFIAMPSKRIGDVGFKDVAHPLSSDVRNKIKDAIFDAYEKALAEAENEVTPEETQTEATEE